MGLERLGTSWRDGSIACFSLVSFTSVGIDIFLEYLKQFCAHSHHEGQPESSPLLGRQIYSRCMRELCWHTHFFYKGGAFQFKAVAIQRLAACSLHAESMHGLLESICHYFQSGPAHLDSMTMLLNI